MTDVATKQDQVQVDVGRVPIMIEITEEDRQSAGCYLDCQGCLIWTALRRMGHKPLSVSSDFVRLTSLADVYVSDDLGPQSLGFVSAKNRPFYGKEVVGKQIVLYPE